MEYIYVIYVGSTNVVEFVRNMAQNPTFNAIQVAVRIRPVPESEAPPQQTLNQFQIISSDQLVVKSCNNDVKSFTFDHLFDESATQTDIYEPVKPFIYRFFDGFNQSILAYGQVSLDLGTDSYIVKTSSGKTFTMGLSNELLSSSGAKEHEGIVPRAVADIFKKLQENASTVLETSITVSFIEIYNEELTDLLDKASTQKSFLPKPKPLIREENGNIFVSNLIEEKVSCAEDVLKVLGRGAAARSTGSTDMNATSSRSHAIVSLTLKQKKRTASGAIVNVSSKFNFVDLAGSERLKRTNSEGATKKEGISINRGLLVLGNVISALGDESQKASHISYRDSKLTRLLQESLGGNSQTMMIACISPSQINFSESLATLVYANRARNIQNKIHVNQEFDGLKEMKVLQETIASLHEQLKKMHGESLAAQNSNSLLTSLVTEKESKLQLALAQTKQLSEDLNKAESLISQKQSQLQETEFSLAKSSDECETQKGQVRGLLKKNEEMQAELLAASRLKTVYVKRLEELSSEKTQLWQEKSSALGQVSNLTRETDSLRAKIESQSVELEKIPALTALCSEKDIHLTKLENQIEEYIAINNQLKAQVNQFTLESEKMLIEKSQDEQEKLQLGNCVTDLQTKLSEVATTLLSKEQEVEKLQLSITNAQLEKSNLEALVETNQKTHSAALESKDATYQSDFEVIEQEMKAMSLLNSELNMKIESLEFEASRKQIETVKLQESIDKMNIELSKVLEDNQGKCANISDLKLMISELESKNSALVDEMESQKLVASEELQPAPLVEQRSVEIQTEIIEIMADSMPLVENVIIILNNSLICRFRVIKKIKSKIQKTKRLIYARKRRENQVP